MEKIITDVIFWIGMLCIYCALWYQFKINCHIRKDIDEIKKTACNALFNCDRHKVVLDTLSANLVALASDLKSLREGRFVGRWEERGRDESRS